MRILAIGNSFSDDLCTYAHQIAESLGLTLDCLTAVIGGCSLELHVQMLQTGEEKYILMENGRDTGRRISLKEAISGLGEFDAVTLQQASHFSGMPETYEPYLTQLDQAVRQAQPGAKVWIHQTWAYENDSTHWAFPNYGSDSDLMYGALKKAYGEAAERIRADGVLPSGDAVQYVRNCLPMFDGKNGGLRITRDGFHMGIPYGRMLVGYLLVRKALGADVSGACFVPEGADPTVLEELKRVANRFGA